MSTSRKMRVKNDWQNTGVQQGKPSQRKLPKKSPNQTSVPPPRHWPPSRWEQSPPALRLEVLNLFAFATGCRAKNYLQDSVCSIAHFRANARPAWHTEADNARNLSEPPACTTETFLATAGIVKNLAICLSYSPSEIWPNIHFVFYPAVSGPKKGKRQATADPDRKTTSSSDSDSSSSQP